MYMHSASLTLAHNALHSPSYTVNYRMHVKAILLTCNIIPFSLICDRHCTSKIAINISIFHLGSYKRRARNCPDAERSAPPIFEATAHLGRAVNFPCSLCSSGIVLQV